jgi:UDP-N-acetylmuramoyl-L-alanyl-D-glutamate--2,6-diaminopimelate ligase
MKINMKLRSLLKKLIPNSLFSAVEPYGHWVEAILAQIIYGFPAKNLKVIGVTGTDGKTSTSTLITAMLRSSGKKVAMMTTISVDYGDGKGPIDNPSRLTTMGAASLLQKIKRMSQSDVEWLVLETTSHALAQHRVWKIPYTIAVMTNLNHEHLDYHRTFERYRAAKVMLFKQTNRNRKGLRTGFVNREDENWEYFAKEIKYPVTYGVGIGDLKASNVKTTGQGSTYTATIGNDTYEIICNLPGTFNISNSLAAIGVGRAIGLSKDEIEKGIASLKAVEGRMTSVNEGQDFEVIVDYAHTPESFEKIINEVKGMGGKRLITVFGSAGRRDEEKRYTQGEIAGKLSDIVIATEEDDRDVDGQEILNQIAQGAMRSSKKLNTDLFLIHERPYAVRQAVKIAQPGDIVLLLGKGHEKSILSNGPKAAEMRHLPQDDNDSNRVIKKPYDEVTVAREAILERRKP